MKKIVAFTALVIFLFIFIIACGGSKNCPAYSKATTEQSAEENS